MTITETRERIEGDLIVEGNLEIPKSIYVSGSIRASGYIKAEGSIRAGGFIKAGDFIMAGGFIRAGDFIMAGGFIEAGRFIEAGCSIEARESIEAGGHIFSFTFFVYAKRISTRTLPFWRDYWAEMPPLKKWKDRILDESFCWTDYRKMLTKKEAREVCAWDGWHWLLRAHLEMFFGLKKEHVIS